MTFKLFEADQQRVTGKLMQRQISLGGGYHCLAVGIWTDAENFSDLLFLIHGVILVTVLTRVMLINVASLVTLAINLQKYFLFIVNKGIKIFGVDVDEAVKTAIATAVEHAGSQRAFAASAGVTTSQPGKYLGTIKGSPAKTIPHDTYERLYPLIREWLPSDPRYLPLSKRTGLVVPVAASTRTCKVYGLAQCAASGIQFGDVMPDNEHDLEDVPVPPEINNVKRLAAFRAIDTSMAPKINEGDILYIDPDAVVAPGNVVLVKYDSSVVCKRWRPAANGKTVVLASDNPEAEPIVVQAREIEWCYRVVMRVTREVL